MVTETANQYSKCFKTLEPKKAQIARAVAILLEAQGKPENPTLMRSWANHLEIFSGDQLAGAFAAVALTSKGWPTLGDITEPILEAEYAADFAWLIAGLQLHGAEWKEKPAHYGQRWRKPGAGIDDWEDPPLIRDAIPAPTMPGRITTVLGRVGAGNIMAGLDMLDRHPLAHGRYDDAGEAARARVAIEREFKAAWMAVRKQEFMSRTA